MTEKLGIVCIHVLLQERPVLLVSKDEGDLVLTCGGEDHAFPGIDDWATAHPSHFTAGDRALGIVRVLSDGEWALRERVGSPWRRMKREIDATRTRST
jgi:hypothetical protein